MNGKYSMMFLGTGSGGNPELGSSAAVLMLNRQPELLIDCGTGVINRYAEHFSALPAAVFITHLHLDHIADLEILFTRAILQQRSDNPPPLIRLYVPVNLVTGLHQRLATYPGPLAEGGENFWNAFQLIPVQESFIHNDTVYQIYPTRHHAPGSSYALHMKGYFFYTGDTRPVPELIHHLVHPEETVFHDCGLISNPSHTGLEDLREYRNHLKEIMVLYHYADAESGKKMMDTGYRVATPGDVFSLGASF